MAISGDSVVYRSIDDLTQKAAVSGTEKIAVSGEEYITPGQILGMGVAASAVPANAATHTEITGDNVQAQLDSADGLIHELREAVSEGGALFHTDPSWGAASLAELMSWVDAVAKTAYDPVNGRAVNDFDVYVADDTTTNYYWDSGTWFELAPSPEVSVGIVKVWSADNRVVNVRLSGVPVDAVTTGSFAVYNAVSGEDIAVESVTGAGGDYVVVIAQQTQNYGITFIG